MPKQEEIREEIREGIAKELHETHKKNCKRMFDWDMQDIAWDDLDPSARLLYRSSANQILSHLHSQGVVVKKPE